MYTLQLEVSFDTQILGRISREINSIFDKNIHINPGLFLLKLSAKGLSVKCSAKASEQVSLIRKEMHSFSVD